MLSSKNLLSGTKACSRPSRARTVALACQLPNTSPSITQTAKKCTAAVVAASIALAAPAHAEKIGEFAGSGFLFKDTVEVVAIDDSEVSGVTLYLTEFQRNIADKLKKDFFSDPSQASLSCAVTGPVQIRDAERISDPSGQEVFSEKKSLNLFQDKTTRVRRLYDTKRNTLVYVAYSTRLSTASDDGKVSTGRYRTSICVLKLPDAPAPAPAAPVEAGQE